MSIRDFSWGKGVWLTTYHPCSVDSREDRSLNLPGTPRATSACRGRPLLYLILKLRNLQLRKSKKVCNPVVEMFFEQFVYESVKDAALQTAAHTTLKL
jgi:hypothetical protein